jgi:hypothetical protein
MGGCCQICNYKKCNAALELHHLDPSIKEFSFGKTMSSPKAWSKICAELKKCILLCSNCHREVHNGVANVPETFRAFNESFVNYRPETVIEMNSCPICGADKPVGYKVCSRSCACKLREKFDWSSIDLYDMMVVQKLSPNSISELINISPTGIRKRAKKLGIITSKC